MPFGLQNAPATFQHFINSVLHEFLDKFASAYLDDIIIYSKSRKAHREHVTKVLAALQKAGLQIDINKCEFNTEETKYLGLIVSTNEIKMDPKKVAAVKDWKTPKNLKELQSFLGFANFLPPVHQRFRNNCPSTHSTPQVYKSLELRQKLL